MSKFSSFAVLSSANRYDTIVMPPYHQKRALVRTSWTRNGNASDEHCIAIAKVRGRTTVTTAASASDTAITLVSDGTKNQLGGIAVAASDFVIVKNTTPSDLRGAWKLCLIAGVDAGGAATAITINSLTGLDGVTGLEKAVAAGSTAYVIWAEDVIKFIPGGTAALGPLYNLGVGEAGCPLGIYSYGAAAAAHAFSGLVEYVD
jgi:hypothetical protein